MSTPIVRRRKRPVEVDTIQWTGSNEADVQAFTGPANFYALDDEDRAGCDDPEVTATVFDNLHNTWVLVYTGQHIVRGVKREFYPIAEDVLAETYEAADTPLHATCRVEAAAVALHAAADEIHRQVPDDGRYVVKKTVVNILRRRANTGGQEATAAAATATPNFFQAGRVYARQHHGRTIEFHVIHVATAPDCEFPTAFGWRKDPEIDVMLPMDADDFHGCGWVDVTEAGDGRD